jgi:hypothetical protein
MKREEQEMLKRALCNGVDEPRVFKEGPDNLGGVFNVRGVENYMHHIGSCEYEKRTRVLLIKYCTDSFWATGRETGVIKVSVDLEEIKPICRPWSDLTKEITVNRETFVPIVRLAMMERNWKEESHTEDFEILEVKSDGNNFGVRLIDFGDSDIPYSFTYGITTKSFCCRGYLLEGLGMDLSVSNQNDLFNFLRKCGFNLEGLPDHMVIYETKETEK